MQRLFYLFTGILFLLFSKNNIAQPATCFEIESILVDACGSPEGENEMVRFIVGPSALNTSALTAAWPNTANPWLGIVQNAQTASKTAALNATIQTCGYLVEPTAGNLPPFSKVLLVTSENMLPAFNSFANLSDTLYIIYQAAGNTAGHFKNYAPGSGPRTLSMQFTAGCADTVTYIVDSLIDQTGLHLAQDGATVNFDYAGNDSYTNPGCQAPVNTLSANLIASNDTVCAGATINVGAHNLTGNYLNYFWLGGYGIYANAGDTLTPYTTSASYTGLDTLVFAIVGTCLDTVYDTLFVQTLSGTAVTISTSGPTTFCQGGSVILTASTASSYLWSNGSTTQNITVSTAGTYTVTATSNCGTSSAQQSVTVLQLPNTGITASGSTALCAGQSVTLTASGGPPYVWSTGATSASITVSSAATYVVTVTNSCGSSTASQSVTVNTVPDAHITSSSGNYILCPGQTLSLQTAGNGNFLWNTGAITSSIPVSAGGTFAVTVTNACGSSTDSVLIIQSNLNAAFTQNTLTGIAPLTINFNNTSTGANTFNWDFGDANYSSLNSPQHIYTAYGNYTVVLYATDSLQCIDTATASVFVDELVDYFIPNVFSPNGDNQNELFYIKGTGIKDYTVQIFNRWGNKVIEFSKNNGGWNGKDKNGKNCSAATYVAVIKLQFVNGKTENRHLSVELVR